jgi:hypothetical protein
VACGQAQLSSKSLKMEGQDLAGVWNGYCKHPHHQKNPCLSPAVHVQQMSLQEWENFCCPEDQEITTIGLKSGDVPMENLPLEGAYQAHMCRHLGDGQEGPRSDRRFAIYGPTRPFT